MKILQGLLLVAVGVIIVIGGLAFVSNQEGKTDITYGTITKVEIVRDHKEDLGMGEERYRVEYTYTYGENSGSSYTYLNRLIINKPQVGDEVKVIIDLSTGLASENLKSFNPTLLRVVIWGAGGILCLAGVSHMFGLVSTSRGRFN